ncbi:MAG: hypothetical protein LUD72_08725 [Bacteroidales bacterium]|nr:hypothetical protein [Bacteroidales bacterium]
MEMMFIDLRKCDDGRYGFLFTDTNLMELSSGYDQGMYFTDIYERLKDLLEADDRVVVVYSQEGPLTLSRCCQKYNKQYVRYSFVDMQAILTKFVNRGYKLMDSMADRVDSVSKNPEKCAYFVKELFLYVCQETGMSPMQVLGNFPDCCQIQD